MYVFLQALVDGPTTGVPRSAYRLSQLRLTKFKISFAYHSGTKTVRKAWNDKKIDEKWKESAWAKQLEAKKKVCMRLS